MISISQGNRKKKRKIEKDKKKRKRQKDKKKRC